MVTGCWSLVAGRWSLDARYWMLDARQKMAHGVRHQPSLRQGATMARQTRQRTKIRSFPYKNPKSAIPNPKSKQFQLPTSKNLCRLTPYMKRRLPGTVKRLNVEHRTSNIERRILMTLRFICFKTS